MAKTSFNIFKDGKKILADILYVIPNKAEMESPYIVYTDYEPDENGDPVMEYALLRYNGSTYNIEAIDDENILNYIKRFVLDDLSSKVGGEE